jgi:hypothetical protein
MPARQDEDNSHKEHIFPKENRTPALTGFFVNVGRKPE